MKQIKTIKSTMEKWAGIVGLAAMAFVLCSMFSVPAYAKSRTYVLECRGGGGMNAMVFKNGEVTIKGFRSGRAAASARHPGPGECAWLDRPMRRDEPKELWDAHRNSPINYVAISGNTTSIRWFNSTSRYPIISVLKAIQTGQVFLVHVKQIRIGKRPMFRIERVGP